MTSSPGKGQVAIDEATLRALVLGGRVFFTDSCLNWALWGMSCVMMIKYLTSLRKGHTEKVWQVCSIVAVFVLNTINVGANLARMIISNTTHFGAGSSYKNAYKKRLYIPISWFLGLLIIVSVQLLVLHRLLSFSVRLQPRMSDRRKLACAGLLALDLSTALLGFLSYSFALRLPEFSQIAQAVKDGRAPEFFVLQVAWSSASIVIVICQAAFVHLDMRRARALSHAADRPGRDLTDEVLQHMHEGFIVNWSLVAGAHIIYLASVASQPMALAGRAAASIPGLYCFGLIAQACQPRATRDRQLLEARQDPYLRAQEAAPARQHKHLYGLSPPKGRKQKAASLARDLGSVCKTVQLTSYAVRDSSFGKADDDESGSSSGGLNVKGDNDLALVGARRIGLGHAVWVESRDGHRQLTDNEHHPPPAAADPMSLREPSRTRVSAARLDVPTLSFASPPPARPPARKRARPYLSSSSQRRPDQQLSFIDSFPAGPTMTKSHGVFDPDDIALHFASKVNAPPTAPDLPLL